MPSRSWQFRIDDIVEAINLKHVLHERSYNLGLTFQE